MAHAIKDGLEAPGVNVSVMKTTEAENIDYFDYSLVCVGCPSIQWHPPKQVTEFLLKKILRIQKAEKNQGRSPKSSRKEHVNLLHLFWTAYGTP